MELEPSKGSFSDRARFDALEARFPEALFRSWDMLRIDDEDGFHFLIWGTNHFGVVFLAIESSWKRDPLAPPPPPGLTPTLHQLVTACRAREAR